MIEITIPILNEAATLEVQVRKIRDFIERNLSDLMPITLVLADNGSTDATPEIGRSLATELDGIRYLRLEERGVGRALKASWNTSGADIVGYMDLDLSTKLDHLRPALETLLSDRADLVTGSRLAKGSQVIGRSFIRNITSRGFNLLLNLFFKVHFSDGMCGFKFLKRNLLSRLFNAGAISNGWFFASELLVTADYVGMRISDLPVVWVDDPNSKVKIVKLIMEYLRAMVALRRRLPKRITS